MGHTFCGDHAPVAVMHNNKQIAGAVKERLSGKGQLGWTAPYKAFLPSVKVEGIGRQGKLSGKNLYDKSKYFNSGIFIGGSGFEKTDNRLVYIKVKPNTAYTAHHDILTNDFRMASSIDKPKFQGNYTKQKSRGRGNGPLTLTTGPNDTWLSVQLLTNSDEYDNNVSIWDCLKSFQIELGSTATPYEPYCGGIPAPNPEYPIEPEFLEGAELQCRGKNLAYGKPIVVSEDGVIRYGMTLPNGKYFVNFDGDGASLLAYKFIKDGVFGQWHDLYRNSIIDCPKGSLLLIYGRDNNANSWIPAENVVISYAPTPYEPFYDGGTAKLPILRALPDGSVKDEYDVATGKLTRRIKEIVMSSSMNWRKNADFNDYKSFFIIKEDYSIPVGRRLRMVCTHASTVEWQVDENKNYWWNAQVSTGMRIDKKYLGADYDSLTTDEERIQRFKNFLDEQKKKGTPVVVWFENLTPIIEQYDPTVIRQHPGYTQLIQNGGFVDADIEAEVYKEM